MVTMPDSARPDLEMLLVNAEFVRGLARSLARDEHTAADIAQETLTAAIARRHHRADGIDSSPRGLLATIARRVAANLARGSRRRTAREAAAAESPPLESTPEQILERESLRRRVVESVLGLDEPYRGTVIARYFDDLSVKQIAQRARVPIETVRTRLKRANAALRNRLDETQGTADWKRGILLLCRWDDAGVASKASAAAAGWLARMIAMSTNPFAVAGFCSVVLAGVWALYGPKRDPLREPQKFAAVTFLRPSAHPNSQIDPTQEAQSDSEPPRRESIAGGGEAGRPDINLEWPPAVGRCVDESGAPIAGAEVAIVEADSSTPGSARENVLATSTTDSSGTFSLQRPRGYPSVALDARGSGVLPDPFVRVRASGFATKRIQLSWDPNDTVEVSDVALARGATVRGAVVDPMGRPLPGVEVSIGREPYGEPAWWRTGIGGGDRITTTLSDGRGEFALDGVPSEWLYVYAVKDQGIVSRSEIFPVDVNATEPQPLVRVVLPILGEEDRIVVLARDSNGNPLPRAHLLHVFQRRFEEDDSMIQSGRNVRADDAGRYEFFTLPSETHFIELADEFGVLATQAGIVRGSPPVVLRARPRRFLKVTVRDESGQPITNANADVEVTAFGQSLAYEDEDGPSDLRAVRSNDSWSFAEPTRPFRVAVSCPGFASKELGPFEPDAARDEIDVRLDAVTGLRGEVRAAGKPIAGARLQLYSRGENSSRAGFATDRTPLADWSDDLQPADVPRFDTAISRPDGSFSLFAEDSGRYFLRIAAAGFADTWLGPLSVSRSKKTKRLAIELGPGGAIEGRVVRADGAPPEGLFVMLAGRGGGEMAIRADATGHYRFEHVSLGSHQLRVRPTIDFTVTDPSDGENPVGNRDADVDRDVDVTVSEGRTTSCDLRFCGRQPERPMWIEGRFRLGGKVRSEFVVMSVDSSVSFDFDKSLDALRDEIAYANASNLVRIGVEGQFELRAPLRRRCQIIFRAFGEGGSQMYHGIPLRLDSRVTRCDSDLAVGSVVVSIANDSRGTKRTRPYLLWRGPDGRFALLRSGPRAVDDSYRFDDVPVGRVVIQVDEMRIEAEVRAGETTTVSK